MLLTPRTAPAVPFGIVVGVPVFPNAAMLDGEPVKPAPSHDVGRPVASEYRPVLAIVARAVHVGVSPDIPRTCRSVDPTESVEAAPEPENHGSERGVAV